MFILLQSHVSGSPTVCERGRFQLLPLIVPLDNGDPPIPDHVQETLRPDDRVEPSTVVDENKSGRKSTVSATLELLLWVRDEPFKSIAGGLRLILENCEVWSLLHIQPAMLTVISGNRSE